MKSHLKSRHISLRRKTIFGLYLKAFIAAGLLIGLVALSSCGVAVKDKLSTWPDAKDPEKNKPSAADFSGTPADFSGRWQGQCTQMSSGGNPVSCTATLTISQGSLKNYVAGSLSYSIGTVTYGPFPLRRLDIDKNDLKNGGVAVGKIGSAAFEFYDSVFGDFSIRLFDDKAIGLNASQMPEQRITKNCPSNYCFVAAFNRVSKVTN